MGRVSHGCRRCPRPRVGASQAWGTLPLPLSRRRLFLHKSCLEEIGGAVTLMGGKSAKYDEEHLVVVKGTWLDNEAVVA